MKKLLTVISVIAAIRLIMTVMIAVKGSLYGVFSMFSIPFFWLRRMKPQELQSFYCFHIY